MKKIIAQIYDHKKEKIGLDELQRIIAADDYLALVGTISQLTQDLVIKPVKSSGKNGCDPGLYMKYHIIKREVCDRDIIDEINSLHYSIATERFLKKPDTYLSSRKLIYTLSEFLKNSPQALDVPLSENERAYEIWGDEKALDKKDGRDNKKILKECGVLDMLNTYPTPEPFFDYRKTTLPQNVLVIENKDTWFTIRKLMIEEPQMCGLFDIDIDCIVYGEGNKVTQKNSSLEDYLNIDAPFNGMVYYWGDLDLEGIDIFLSAVKVNSGLTLLPFHPAYTEMLMQFEYKLSSCADSSILKGHDNQSIPKNISDFFGLFDNDTSSKIKRLLDSGYYVPQEILNFGILKSNIRSMESVK